MNITSYIKAKGNKSFLEMPFNEVDSLILSELAYVNLNLSIKEGEWIKFKDLKIEDPKSFYYGSVDASKNKRMFNAMLKSKRFRNIKAGEYKLLIDTKKHLQFFAITFILPNKDLYIAYRGTDTSILGWREDMYLTFDDKMPSHDLAKDYIDEICGKLEGSFYTGGHSKGGNLATYAVLSMKPELSNRLIKAYSFDGPGFRQNIKTFPNYGLVKDKLAKYLTANDMIGIVYNENEKPYIVPSPGILLGGHDPFYWKVDKKNNCFIHRKKRSFMSLRFEKGVMKWLTEMGDKDKEIAIDVLFELMGESKTIYDLLPNAIKLVATSKKRLEKKYGQEAVDKAKKVFKRLAKDIISSYAPKRKKKAKV